MVVWPAGPAAASVVGCWLFALKRLWGWPQNSPKAAQGGPKTGQDGPKSAQDAPKPAQETPKTASKGHAQYYQLSSSNITPSQTTLSKQRSVKPQPSKTTLSKIQDLTRGR